MVKVEEVHSTFIARQAILDINLKTIGYELLFRDSLDNVFKEASPEKATSKVILQNHILGDLSTLCFGKLAFINFDEFTLLQNTPLLFNAKSIVVELLETINITDELIFHVSQLHKKGYVVALDDYDFSTKWECLLPYISIIKIDIEDISFKQIETLKNKLISTQSKIKIVVERVETLEQFEILKAMEIDYYQGYFFHKPEIKAGTCIPPLKLNLIQLFLEAYKPHLDFNQLAEIISRDVTLVSGILKVVNSASECGNIEITSIKQAITYLGANKVKQYVAIISMSALSSESPSELFKESLVRAKMMELIANEKPFKASKDMAFLTGILSNLDAILCLPMKEVVRNLPFSQKIESALLGEQGSLFELLELAKAYETHDCNSMNNIITSHKVSGITLLDSYDESLKWVASIV